MRQRWIVYGLGAMLVMAAIFLIIWVGSLQTQIGELPQTGSGACAAVRVGISSDDSNEATWKDTLTYTELPVRFYLKVTDNANPDLACPDINLAAYYQRCSLTDPANCTAFAHTDPWGPFRTDQFGVARIDNAILNLTPGYYQFSFRPSQTLAVWSNEVLINIGSSAKQSAPVQPIKMSDYLVSNVGTSYLFNSYNYIAPTSLLGMPVQGTASLTVENDAVWGGYLVRPWLITKDASGSYWFPGTGEDSVRLMLAAPDNNFNYYWSPGYKSYLAGTDNFDLLVAYSSINNIPPHFLAPKTLTLPGVILNDDALVAYTSGNPNFPPAAATSDPPQSGRMIRLEKLALPLTVGGVTYPDVVRLDQYEGTPGFDLGNITYRETWYLAKGVGLVKLTAKYFSAAQFSDTGPGEYQYILSCQADSDCLADEITAPHFKLELQKYQVPARLQVTVSRFKDNGDCSENITPSGTTADCALKIFGTETDSFYLKLTDSSYTGYLEAQSLDGKVFRSFYVTNGNAVVKLSDLPAGMEKGFQLRFRTWTPDGIFPGEQRSNIDLPWSNLVRVTIS